jgi:hypothetical protein
MNRPDVAERNHTRYIGGPLEAQRRYKLANRQKINAKARLYRQNHPERHRSAVKKWKAKNPLRTKQYHKKSYLKTYHQRTYGISRDEFEQMLISQTGLCKICGRELGIPCLDHDHFTGKVRGILCLRCNQGLGHFDDSPLLLRKAIEYLEVN